MDIMELGAQILAQKLGGNAAGQQGNVQDVLGGLLAGNNGQVDLAGLVAGLQGSGLADIAASWLGDGANAGISVDQIRDLLGGDKIGQAASQLGTDEGSLLDGLSSALPEMVDKSSSGGSLLDAVGGLEGVASLAKKFL
jgi:uncharacterized protein YidB (DUF937 family)